MFSIHNHHISRKTFKEVLLKVVEVVEEKSISEEVVTTQCGSIVHDGSTYYNGTHYIDLWTYNGTHYIDLFAAYCRPINVKTKTSFSTESKLELTLLACSPMANIEQEDGLPNVD
jgi:hypothetical protein